jgi:DNA transposition AAA+ family ATPase
MNGEGVKRYWEEAARRGLSLRAAAKAAGLDGSTLCRALKGTYAGDAAAVEAKCARALDAMSGPAVIQTSVVAGCRAVCAAAFAAREIGMVWGPTQSGKTTALEQCCRESGEYRMFRFPATAGTGALAEEIARAYGVTTDGAGFRENRRRIMDAARDTLLIADEVHEAFAAHGHGAAVRELEFIREIYDRTGCGVVLCGTEALPRSFGSNQFAAVLRQTLERGLVRKAFGGRPAWRDVTAAARHHGIAEALDDAASKQWQARLKGMSFGAVCRLLRSAAHMAGKRGRPMAWERVAEALATLDQFAAAE